ncbi:MAG: inositol monophosphatase [Gammaproteobacteria bacterium]|nr:MAG: inositol monophosphatase [Gammaproteobacteria bacterium]
MQPMINIALRAVRSNLEHLLSILEREKLSLTDPDNVKRMLSRVESSFYETLARGLERAYPKHHIAKRGDLSGPAKGFSWHVMPLHNRLNLIKGLPDWGFSVVCKKDGQTEHALILMPALGLEYTASRGHGAELNGRRIRVANLADESLAVGSSNLISGLGKADDETPVQEILDLHLQLEKRVFALNQHRSLAIALAHLAAGKTDVVISKQPDPQELAAGLLIAKEAGALSSDFNGGPVTERSPAIMVASAKLTKRLLPVFKGKQSLFG